MGGCHLRLFFAQSLLLLLAGSSTAQTITGTLFGVAYPTAIVQFTNGAYDFPGPVLFIGNHPQIDILGVGAGGQTTFSYRDIITQNVGGPKGAAPVTVTQDGILVQNAGGMFFSEPPTAAIIPVVQTCAFDATGAAICEFYNDGNAADVFTVTGTKEPFFTFIAALPTPTSPVSGSSVATSPPTSKSGNDSSRAKSTKSPTSSPTGSVAPVPSPHKVPVGAIVGAVIGGVVLIGAAIAVLLLCRRRRRNAYPREKVEFDPEPAHTPAIPLNPFTQQHHPSTSDTPLLLSSSGATSGAATTATTASSAPEMRRERRRRLKQMQDTVQQLQRNLSVQMPESESGSEPQVASQQRQIAVLLSEVERLRAIVARDEALPAYEE